MRRLLVATITARGDRWSVSWAGIGQKPRALRAPTLTAAANQAFNAASALRARNASEIQITIYPGPFRGGPTFDIAGAPGELTATSNHRPGQTFHGWTLEDLADAVEQTRTDSHKGFRLRWIRQMTLPITPVPLQKPLSASEQQPTQVVRPPASANKRRRCL